MSLITMKDIQIAYENARDGSVFVAVDDVEFDVVEGEFVTILGPSGCGKSSLLLALDGLIRPSRGEIRMHGSVVEKPGHDRAMVFQEAALLPWRTVIGNILFGLELHRGRKTSRAEDRNLARELIKLVGLDGFEDRYPHQLSGGMRQRVGLARALAVDPEVLLMDEPFGALDAYTREIMATELLRIWNVDRKTVLFVTHSIDEAIFLADRCVVMTKGPGTIKEIVDIDIPRPRDVSVRASDAFGEYRTRLWDLLFDEPVEQTIRSGDGDSSRH